MATITAEIDLDNLDADILIEELSDRLSKKKFKRIGAKERASIMDALNDMCISPVVLIKPLFSIEDQAKRDIILEKWNQYTAVQLEAKLA